MIKYSLGCADGHQFESWFPDSAAYEKQRKRGLIACPECGLTSVDKAVMAPAVVGVERSVPASSSETLLDAKRRQVRDVIARMRREIEANTDDVGAKFPEVARAMHAGEEPERAIRGLASRDEARALIEEGVGVLPVPALADEFN
ncbi:MAG TPA: DUF1178 family protein [Roseiarcus sp.]|nr:DUF1178 family protein [Roseiarcus sp.]